MHCVLGWISADLRGVRVQESICRFNGYSFHCVIKALLISLSLGEGQWYPTHNKEEIKITSVISGWNDHFNIDEISLYNGAFKAVSMVLFKKNMNFNK